MSERRQEAVPVAFRVLEREGGPEADVLAWLTPPPEDVHPLELVVHRSAGASAWIPRQAGDPNARAREIPASSAPSREAAAGLAPANDPQAAANVPVAKKPVSNVPVANTPVSNTPVSNTLSKVPGSSIPVSSRPVTDLPPSSVPVSNVPVSSRPVAEAPHDEAEMPLVTSPSANDRPSLSAPAVPPALLEAMDALATARGELLAHAEGELVELAVEIARSILGVELETRPELHRALARAAVEVLDGEATPRVRLSPESFDALLTATGSRTLEAHGRRIELEPDSSVRGPGAILDAGSASVDGRLETRLERVRAALLVARRGVVIGEAA
jgi:hypothetical protein